MGMGSASSAPPGVLNGPQKQSREAQRVAGPGWLGSPKSLPAHQIPALSPKSARLGVGAVLQRWLRPLLSVSTKEPQHRPYGANRRGERLGGPVGVGHWGGTVPMLRCYGVQW